jgi:hypothetical protein
VAEMGCCVKYKRTGIEEGKERRVSTLNHLVTVLFKYYVAYESYLHTWGYIVCWNHVSMSNESGKAFTQLDVSL